jgi:hypothetical protein
MLTCGARFVEFLVMISASTGYREYEFSLEFYGFILTQIKHNSSTNQTQRGYPVKRDRSHIGRMEM